MQKLALGAWGISLMIWVMAVGAWAADPVLPGNETYRPIDKVVEGIPLLQVPQTADTCTVWDQIDALRPVFDACQKVIQQSQTYHRAFHPGAAEQLETDLRKFLALTQSTPGAPEIEKLQTQIRTNWNAGYRLKHDWAEAQGHCGGQLGQSGEAKSADHSGIRLAIQDAPFTQGQSPVERQAAMEAHLHAQEDELANSQTKFTTAFSGCKIAPETAQLGEGPSVVVATQSKQLVAAPIGQEDSGSNPGAAKAAGSR